MMKGNPNQCYQLLSTVSYLRMSEATSAGRIGTRFEESVSSVLEIILGLPDDQNKLDLIQEAIQQIRFLKNEVQYNAHMAILSTIAVDADEGKEDSDNTEGKGLLTIKE